MWIQFFTPHWWEVARYNQATVLQFCQDQQKKTLSCLPAEENFILPSCFQTPPPYGGLEKEAQVLGSAFEKTKDFFQDLFPSLMNMLHCKWAMTRYFQTMILKSCKRTIRGWWPEVLWSLETLTPPPMWAPWPPSPPMANSSAQLVSQS